MENFKKHNLETKYLGNVFTTRRLAYNQTWRSTKQIQPIRYFYIKDEVMLKKIKNLLLKRAENFSWRTLW